MRETDTEEQSTDRKRIFIFNSELFTLRFWGKSGRVVRVGAIIKLGNRGNMVYFYMFTHIKG